jgi:acetyl esterase/lipase
MIFRENAGIYPENVKAAIGTCLVYCLWYGGHMKKKSLGGVTIKPVLFLFLTLNLVRALPLHALGSKDPQIDEYNVRYGKNASQAMDVYIPVPTAVPSPAVIMIHGGAWHWGSRNDAKWFCETLKKNGFAVFNMDYRLGNESGYLTLAPKIEDISLVVAYIEANRARLGLSGKVHLAGGSAGGHLALQYAYTEGRGKIASVFSQSGPTDLTNPRYVNGKLKDAVQALVGQSWSGSEAVRKAYRADSPLFRVTGGEAPTLLVHGDEDPVVDYQDSVHLSAELQAHGVQSKLITVPGGNHGTNWTNWEAIELDALEWFRTYDK